MSDLFGRTMEDRITGFRGVVIGRVEYSTGCNQILLAPRCTDPAKKEGAVWIDEQRLVVDDAVDQIILDNGSSPGCDRPAPAR